MLSNLSESDVLTSCLAISGWIVLRSPTADGPPWWINHFARRGSLICENLYEPRVAKRRALLSSSVKVKSDVGRFSQEIVQSQRGRVATRQGIIGELVCECCGLTRGACLSDFDSYGLAEMQHLVPTYQNHRLLEDYDSRQYGQERDLTRCRLEKNVTVWAAPFAKFELARGHRT